MLASFIAILLCTSHGTPSFPRNNDVKQWIVHKFLTHHSLRGWFLHAFELLAQWKFLYSFFGFDYPSFLSEHANFFPSTLPSWDYLLWLVRAHSLHMFSFWVGSSFACLYLKGELRRYGVHLLLSRWRSSLVFSLADDLELFLDSSNLRLSHQALFLAWVLVPRLVLSPVNESKPYSRVVESLQVFELAELERLALVEFAGVVPISLAVDPSSFWHHTNWLAPRVVLLASHYVSWLVVTMMALQTGQLLESSSPCAEQWWFPWVACLFYADLKVHLLHDFTYNPSWYLTSSRS